MALLASGLAGHTAARAAAAAEGAEAAAAGAPLDTITVTATRRPQNMFDVPATVSVFDAEDLADTLTRDIRDLVRFEPGVSVRRAPARFTAALSSTGRAGNEGFNIRGLEGNRVLIQVDGIRVPDGFSFGAQAAGRGDYVDLGLVKSVEILRGPASALYGSDGLAGAVSFITADPQDFLGESRNYAGLGRVQWSQADNQFTGTAILTGRVGDFSALAAYTRRDFAQLDNQGEVGGVGASRTRPNPQDGASNAFLGKLVWAPADAHRLRFTFEHLDERIDTEVLTAQSASVLATNARDETERRRFSLDWRYAPAAGLIEAAQLAAYRQRGANSQFTFEDRATLPDRERLNTYDTTVTGAAGEARLAFATGRFRHGAVLGGDYSKTRVEGVRDGTVPPAGETFPTRAFPPTDFQLAGLFIADEISMGEGRFTLFPALRWDWYDLAPEVDALTPQFPARGQSDSRLSPKLGAVARLDGGVSLFANWAQGFKAPAPGQVNQFFENLTSPFFAYRTLPNPDLRPETSSTFEAGLRLRAGPVRAQLTGYRGRYRDFISQEQVGGRGTIADPIIFQFVNLSSVRIHGVEGQVELRAASGLSGDLAFATARGRVEDARGELPLISIDPARVVSGLGWRDPADRFGAQLIWTAVSRKKAAETDGLCTPSCLRPEGYSTLDFTAFARWRAFILRIGLFNLTDKRHADWSDVRPLAATPANVATLDAFTQPGRNLSVSLTARF
jgi:hemoglobin/transferrin/lactoferrin receptor protein